VEPPDFDAPGAASALDAENIALESTRTIDIDELVPKSDIDELDLVRPWYIVPKARSVLPTLVRNHHPQTVPSP
jgi:hypothetical protein